jgi:hypothetical protein
MEEYEALLQEIKKAMFVVINRMKKPNLTQDKEIQLRRELIVLQQQWLDTNEFMVSQVLYAKCKTERQLSSIGDKN